MSDVVNIIGGPATKAGVPNAAVIELLRDLLMQAEAGKIQHIGVVWLGPDLIPMDAYSGGGDPFEVVTLVGSLELLKHTVLAQLKDQ